MDFATEAGKHGDMIAEMLESFIEGKDEVAIGLLRGMDENIRIAQGLRKFKKRLESEEELTESNLKYMLKIAIKSQAVAADNSARAMAALICYSLSDTFKYDSVAALMKMGKGNKVLRRMMKEKIKPFLEMLAEEENEGD